MSDVNPLNPVREYINALVHSTARGDPLTAARHRSFIATRMIGGLVGIALLPVYLVARGGLTLPEAALFGWFLAPIAVAFYLSGSGRYETAQLAWAAALTLLITGIASATGGLASPAAMWLILVPAEAVLGASRRVVAGAAGIAGAGAAVLIVLGSPGLGMLPEAAPMPPAATVLVFAGAILYAALTAMVAAGHAKVGASRLDEEEQRYRFLARNMTDGISRHARGGIVVFVSPATEALFGVPGGELLGHGLLDRVHVSDRPAYLSALSDAAHGVGSGSVEFRARRRGEDDTAASFVWIEMRCRSLAPDIGDGGAAPDYDVVAVMRDVTDRKRQEAAAMEARHEAESANTAKGRFLATMSHELRTPLNAVIGFSEMLMHEEAMQIDAEKRRDYARLIHDSGQHLLGVVNLVLDMSKIETGHFVITPEPVAPAPVVRNCCELMALKARDSGLDIVISLPADLPEIVADKRALRQMLLNLLSNAIKFTDRGGQVKVSAAVTGEDMVITIADTGVGINEADLPRIGSAFFQAHNSYDRPYDGTGLGLSIVKGLAELHGGRLELDSRVGVGTAAALWLPLDCEAKNRDAGSSVVALGARPAREEDALAAGFGRLREEVKKRA